jgi:HSP20 family protein
MNVSQLIPWNRTQRASTAMANRDSSRDPFFALQREMNRLFDDVWQQFDLPVARMGEGAGGGWPRIELSEGNKEFTLVAELPGMSEEDVEVMFVNDSVVLRGERREERKQEDANPRLSERYHGRFERQIPLDAEIEPDKARAEFRNGVLTVSLPKSPQAQTEAVRIPVNKAA